MPLKKQQIVNFYCPTSQQLTFNPAEESIFISSIMGSNFRNEILQNNLNFEKRKENKDYAK